jgi:hypothetical protein
MFLKMLTTKSDYFSQQNSPAVFTPDTQRLLSQVWVYPMALKFHFVKIQFDLIIIVFISLKNKFQREVNKKTFTMEEHLLLLSCSSSDSFGDFLFKSVDRYCLHGPEASSLARRGISPLPICQYFIMSSFVQVYIFRKICTVKHNDLLVYLDLMWF